MRISDWSSDVCSSDLMFKLVGHDVRSVQQPYPVCSIAVPRQHPGDCGHAARRRTFAAGVSGDRHVGRRGRPRRYSLRSEEHTSELQSLMRISYAVFCLKKKKTKITIQKITSLTKKAKYILINHI